MAGAPSQQQPPSGGMSWMFLFLMVMFMIFFVPGIRILLGNAIGAVFNPLIGFGGTAPLWTIFFGCIIVVLISQFIRHWLTDYIKIAREQKHMSAFNKEMMAARRAQDNVRVKKLMELQPQVMAKQMEVQNATMKPSVFTILIFIAFYTWIIAFSNAAAVRYVSLPWEPSWPLLAGSWFPYSVLLYILFSIPLSQMVVNTLKYISFSKRLRELEAEGTEEVLA